jgi:hypothetical protein
MKGSEWVPVLRVSGYDALMAKASPLFDAVPDKFAWRVRRAR